jgi:hypothetical protein
MMPVSLLSTMHDSVGMASTKKTNRKTVDVIMKAKPVVDYSKGTGEVDKVDRDLASYNLTCHYIKGYFQNMYLVQENY